MVHFRGRIFPVAMRYFDLHCDSVSKAYSEDISPFDQSLDIKIDSDKFIKREQCFALWLDDKLQGESAFSYCKGLLRAYKANENEILKRGVVPHLTLENGSCLGGDINNISYFKSQGATMMSLTWNGENDLASGVNFTGGIKSLGRAAIKEMEGNNIILDVSHLNEEGFKDVCSLATKPFVASHSCCYDICQNKRNLKSWQIKEIISRGGLIGINFYPSFLGAGKIGVFEKVKENIELILSFGGEDNIAIGSDFDGAKMSQELSSADDVIGLYEYLVIGGMGEQLLDKVFYSNASSFFESLN